jgi:hypothetical protein
MSKIVFYATMKTSKGESFYGFETKDERDKFVARPIPKVTKAPDRYRRIKNALKCHSGQKLVRDAKGKVSVFGEATKKAKPASDLAAVAKDIHKRIAETNAQNAAPAIAE